MLTWHRQCWHDTDMGHLYTMLQHGYNGTALEHGYEEMTWEIQYIQSYANI